MRDATVVNRPVAACLHGLREDAVSLDSFVSVHLFRFPFGACADQHAGGRVRHRCPRRRLMQLTAHERRSQAAAIDANQHASNMHKEGQYNERYERNMRKENLTLKHNMRDAEHRN